MGLRSSQVDTTTPRGTNVFRLIIRLLACVRACVGSLACRFQIARDVFLERGERGDDASPAVDDVLALAHDRLFHAITDDGACLGRARYQ